MKKAELIELIAKEAGIPKTTANLALEAFITGVQQCMQSGDQLSLNGLGTFSTYTRSSRNGINPKTKEILKISEKRMPKFKASKSLMDKIANTPAAE
ncbi:MAG: HU family DNA-binding protein [Chitinophagia bacterium]|nr:HU family DNA-binding protein [Chitinophagia bacterium]